MSTLLAKISRAPTSKAPSHAISLPSRTGRKFSLLGLVTLLALSFNSFAADPDVYANKKGAIRGADTVAYWSLEAGADAVKGSDEFTHEYMGATWKFASEENRDLFAANPEKYAPQYGGYCAFAVSNNFTKSVNPDVWEIVDGKLYLNFNRIAYRKWKKDVATSIVNGDKNWPVVLKSCEKHNNCG